MDQRKDGELDNKYARVPLNFNLPCFGEPQASKNPFAAQQKFKTISTSNCIESEIDESLSQRRCATFLVRKEPSASACLDQVKQPCPGPDDFPETLQNEFWDGDRESDVADEGAAGNRNNRPSP